MDFIAEITHWHWFICAVVLGILELLVPGAVFIWMGLSAAIIGSLVLFMPELDWGIQVISFTILSIVSVISARFFISKRNVQSDHPLLNEKSAQFIGKTYPLVQDSQNGVGKVKIGDSLWEVELPHDEKKETAIQITQAQGVILKGEIKK